MNDDNNHSNSVMTIQAWDHNGHVHLGIEIVLPNRDMTQHIIKAVEKAVEDLGQIQQKIEFNEGDPGIEAASKVRPDDWLSFPITGAFDAKKSN